MNLLKTGLSALALSALPIVGACSETKEETAGVTTKDESTETLASALSQNGDTSKLSGALTKSELSGLLDGPGSYTVLAPTDQAFAALGKDGEALFAEDQKPLLIALVRDHMLPGHLTPETIAKAIVDKGGPVTMTTLGEGEVTFTQDGDKINVTMPGGAKATITGTSTAANNGVVIPLDAVLLPPKQA